VSERIVERVAASPPAVAGQHRRSWWPIAIALGLAIVVLTNAAFAFVAVRGADQIVPSYRVEQR
jgi:hypothetical protein